MQLWLIPLLPLAGFLINGVFGRRFSKGIVNTIALGSVALSFAWVLKTIFALGSLAGVYSEHYFTWIRSGAVNIGCDFGVDRLTIVMLLVVTGVGALIHIYSIGYMAHEGGLQRALLHVDPERRGRYRVRFRRRPAHHRHAAGGNRGGRVDPFLFHRVHGA